MLRTTLILLTIGLLHTAHAQSNQNDFSSIRTALNYYLDGGTNNDFSILSKAFHETATMKYMAGDTYREVNALDFFKKGMKQGPAQDRKTSISSIEVIGNVAQARILIEYDTFFFHDFMQLMLVEGEWKITAKTFYKENK